MSTDTQTLMSLIIIIHHTFTTFLFFYGKNPYDILPLLTQGIYGLPYIVHSD